MGQKSQRRWVAVLAAGILAMTVLVGGWLTSTPASAQSQAPCGDLRQEAEAGVVVGNGFEIRETDSASGGAGLWSPAFFGNRYVLDEDLYVDFCMNVVEPGAHVVTMTTVALNNRSDSVWVEVIGSDVAEPVLWHIPRADSALTHDVVAAGTREAARFELPAGPITLRVHQREDTVWIDTVELRRETNETSGPVDECDGQSPAIDQSQVIVQAEQGTRQGTFEEFSEPINGAGDYSIGNFVGVSPDANNLYTFDPNNFVEMCVRIPFAATWEVDVRAVGPDTRADSFFWTLDGGEPATWHIPIKLPRWVRFPLETRELSAGDHHLRFYQRESGSFIDQVWFKAVQVEGTCDVAGVAVVTTISQPECDALVALFNATGGVNWNQNTRWATATDPCTWFGVSCGFAHVDAVVLTFNGLTGELPSEVGDLQGLRTLGLSSNALTSMPAEIGRLDLLRTLELSRNQLSSVPTEIGDLAELRRLELTNNPLGQVPDEIGNLSRLITLRLSGAELSELPSTIGQLDRLQYLFIYDNEIGALPPEIGELADLRTLWAYRNNLAALPSELSGLDQLTKLSLVWNQLGGDLTSALIDLTDTVGVLELDDGPGGNDCITVTDDGLGAWLTTNSPGWDTCD